VKNTKTMVILWNNIERRINMNTKLHPRFISSLLMVLFIVIGFSAKGINSLSDELQDTTKKPTASIPKAEQSVTQHKIVIGGLSIPYKATIGTLIVRNKKDLPYASMGYTAYTRDDISDPGHRPITFAYNGGPGSCSIWLHMGALGPRHIVTNDTAYTPPPPYKIVDNEYSILDKTDLVMIDPVGTGFSHAIGEAKDKDFWSVDPDIESIAWFIRQYITENGRWNSPKYILGESYGTTRSAGIADYLQSREYMSLNGVILVSMATDLELIFDDIPGYHWPSMFELPTYTAVAWYHKILPDPPAELAPLLDEVRTFAFQEYAKAMAQGNNLPDSERKFIIEKIHRYTGLSADYLEKADMRVTESQFANELMRDHRETVGSLDARFLGVNFDPLAKNTEYDPMDAAITPAFAAAFLDYLHRDLNFGQGKTYVFEANVWNIWDYRHKIEEALIPQPMVNTGIDLAHAMGFNPNLRVLVLQGLYDMGTPFLATEYMISHLNLRKDLRSHIKIQYYDAGHMMYIHEPSLKKFKIDIAAFIDQTNHH
jgi:carboxypeptidase C (cathepsin A)